MASCDHAIDPLFYLEDLKSKFAKINPSEYYLSYSGGRDSHFLLWFIREYAKIPGIEVVGINTTMEHYEILKRILDHSDTVLRPEKLPEQVKEQYGIPCFSKWQDDMIHRYQRGSRAPYLIERITGIHKDTGEKMMGRFVVSKKARELLLSGKLHKVSPKCCDYVKKRPARAFEKRTGKKPILGVRSAESALREKQYTSCFTSKGTFTPIHDLTDELMRTIEREHGIEVPKIYDHICRTGCMGCPYGSYKGDTQKELKLISENQLRRTNELFRESYDVLGIK